jgi:YegS/Rv2252/BmrU family lipid kinase
MPSFTAVVNENAGGGRAVRRAMAVTGLLRNAGMTVTVARSRNTEHGRALARDAVGAGDTVLACGGDGTVRSIAGAVAAAGGTLGVIPGGRGDDLARYLRLPEDEQGLAAMLANSETRMIDLIDAEGHTVVGSVYAGVDGRANEIADHSRFVPAKYVYTYAATRAFLGWRPSHYRVTVDGASHDVRAYSVIVANAPYYGGGLWVAPAASCEDGQLDVVVLGDIPRRYFPAVMRELPEGRHVARPEVSMYPGATVRIESARPLLAHGDGEHVGPLPLTLTVRPGALRVVVP